MSDISKKIFSIDPEPDEGPLAHVPSPEEETEQTASQDDAHDLRTTPDPDPIVFRPILDVVDLTEDDIAESPDRDEGHDDDREEPEELSEETARAPISETVRFDDIVEDPVTEVAEDPIALSSDQIVTKPGTPPPPPPPQPEMHPAAETASIIAPVAVVPRRTDVPEAIFAPSLATQDDNPPRSLGWVGVLLGLFTALAVGALVFAYVTSAETISAFGFTALILAIVVPAITVILLWVTLRALAASQFQASRLEKAATRLTTPSDAVADDVERLVDRIQAELSALDRKLSASRADTEALSNSVQQHAASLETLSATMADRSGAILETSRRESEAFTTLLSTLDQQTESAVQSSEAQRQALSALTEETRAQLEATRAQLAEGAEMLGESGRTLNRTATDAEARLRDTAQALSTRSEHLAGSLSQIETRLGLQIDRLDTVSKALSENGQSLEGALVARTTRLDRLDSEADAAEVRLTRLLDRAVDVRDELMARLQELETSMVEFDGRTRSAAETMTSRVGDGLSGVREELSRLESDMSALRSSVDRLQTELTNRPAAAPIAAVQPAASANLDMTPITEADLQIPSEPEEPALELPQADALPSLFSDAPAAPPADVVRRPGAEETTRKPFGRVKSQDNDRSGWRWRDMLGVLDSTDEPPAAIAPPAAAPTIERPPAGVPLSPPPPAPALPDGSDVVARLCEVKLAPSAVVDEGTIMDATAARQNGGETRQTDVVVARLNAPIIHLRGVLAADLEFRLRAETFRRNFDAHLATLRDSDAIRAEMGSASGRAYLLCAAALSTG